MLPNVEFEKRKLELNLLRYGTQAKFFCFEKNSFGEEVTDKKIKEFEVKGILHIVKEYVQRKVDDSSVTKTKFTPMLLCMYDSVLTLLSSPMDFYCEVANKLYRVNGISNVGESDYSIDVSLEVVDYGERPI